MRKLTLLAGFILALTPNFAQVRPTFIDYGHSGAIFLQGSSQAVEYVYTFDNPHAAGPYHFTVYNGHGSWEPNRWGVENASIRVNGKVVVASGVIGRSTRVHEATAYLHHGQNRLEVALSSTPNDDFTFIFLYITDRDIER